MYFAIKSRLWDLFPAWEDKAVDAAFREMLWASQGGSLLIIKPVFCHRKKKNP